jgi:hypothetical protein
MVALTGSPTLISCTGALEGVGSEGADALGGESAAMFSDGIEATGWEVALCPKL